MPRLIRRPRIRARQQVRIITWNCRGAFRKKHEHIAALKPDILIVQECEVQEKWPELGATAIHRIGDSPHKGLAVVSFGPWRAQPAHDPPPDLRYFLPTPPVPVRWRRRLLAFGSGDPTRAICSSLIAQAFGRIRYPILPRITREFRADQMARTQRREILEIRHHSLYVPRDFDLSPYFHIVKPTLATGFDYRGLTWSDQTRGEKTRAAG